MPPSFPKNDNYDSTSNPESGCREVRFNLHLKTTCCRECHIHKSFTTLEVDNHPAGLCCTTMAEVIFHHGGRLGTITEERIRYMVSFLQKLIHSSTLE